LRSFVLLFLAISCSGQPLTIASSQHSENWCWEASAEMLSRFHPVTAPPPPASRTRGNPLWGPSLSSFEYQKARLLKSSESDESSLESAIKNMIDAVQRDFEPVRGPDSRSQVKLPYNNQLIECDIAVANMHGEHKFCTYSLPPPGDQASAEREFEGLKTIITKLVPSWNPRPDPNEGKYKTYARMYHWSARPEDIPSAVTLIVDGGGYRTYRLLLVFVSPVAARPSTGGHSNIPQR
jgi:hypothetical protein